ncbi:E3 ubiquitin-protein ligase ubr1 [Blastocladiella emersonii ATCC 22665]|nr:E3 ubiquitin-protein ligase ubr1 [Blastocladiella emersonii ATCC 22665]
MDQPQPPATPPTTDPPHHGAAKAALQGAIEGALDAFLDAFVHAPESTVNDPLPEAIAATERLLRVPGDAAAASLASPVWVVHLWNDEIHSFVQVIQIVERATRCSRREAERTAVVVDDVGRAVVLETADLAAALQCARTLREARLGVTVQIKRDYLRETTAAAAIVWIHHLVLNAPPEVLPTIRAAVIAALFAPHVSSVAPSDHPGLLDPRELQARYNLPDRQNHATFPVVAQARSNRPAEMYPLLAAFFQTVHAVAEEARTLFLGNGPAAHGPPMSPTTATAAAAVDRSSRLYRMFLVDHKLWKRLRAQVVELFVGTVIVDPVAKLQFAHHFAAAYPSLLASYSCMEREKDLSLFNLSVQIFTSGSVARSLVAAGFFYQLLAMLASLLGSTTLASHEVGFVQKWKLDMAAPIIAQRDYLVLLGHLRYLARCDAVQQLMRDDLRYLHAFMEALTLIHGQHPQRRQTGFHVEYEDESLGEMQNITIHLVNVLSPVAKPYIGNAAALDMVATTLIEGQPTYDLAVLPCGTAVPRGSILDARAVAMYNHLHLLLAALKPSRDWAVSRARATQNPADAMYLFDAPLSTLAMTAHVQAGLWVRNGHMVRSLVHYYAIDPRFRSDLYDADVRLVQLAAQAIDPRQVLPWILDRYGVYPGAAHPAMAEDLAKTMTVLEDLVLTLITLATDDPDLDVVERARRAIIHGLALKPKTYSELTADIPAPVLEATEAQFDDLLETLTTMVTIESSLTDTTAAGAKFTLRPEFRAAVQPFYKHFSRNDRLEVAKHLARHGLANVAPPVRPEFAEFLFHPLLAPWIAQVLLVATARAHASSVDAALFLLAVLSHDDGVVGAALPPFAPVQPPAVARVGSDNVVGAWEQRSDSPMPGMYPPPPSQPQQQQPAAAPAPVQQQPIGSAWVRMLAAAPTLVKIVYDLPPAPMRDWVVDAIRRRAPHLLPVPPVPAAADAPATADAAGTDAAGSDAEAQLAARKRAAAERQRKMLEDMQRQQASFAANFADEMDDDEDFEDAEDLEDPSNPVALSCLVCQQTVNENEIAGYTARIETSSLVRVEDTQAELAAAASAAGKDGDHYLSLRGQVAVPGLHVSTCGHVLHQHCLDTYLVSIQTRHATQRSRNHPELAAFNEFLCPLCKALCNSLVYIHPAAHREQARAAARILHGHDDGGRVLDPATSVFAPGRPLAPAEVDRVYNRRIDELVREKKKAAVKAACMTHAARQAQVHASSAGGSSSSGADGGASAAAPPELDVQHILAAMNPVDNPDGFAKAPFLGPVAMVSPAIDRAHAPLATFVYTLAALEVQARPAPASPDGAPEWPRGSPLVLGRMPSHVLPFLRQLALNVRASAARVAAAAGGELPRIAIGDVLAAGTDPFGWLVVQTLFPPPATISGDDGDAVMAEANGACDDAAWRENIRIAAAAVVAQEGSERAVVFLRKALLLRAATVPGLYVSPYLDYPTEAEQMAHVLQLAWPPAAPVLGDLLPPRRRYVDFPGAYRLIPLPRRLDTLLARRLQFVCARCNTTPRDVAQCLVCGARLCMQSFCCNDPVTGRGECMQHMAECTGDTGLFLDLTRVALVLLHEEKGHFLPVPYLDSHGEVDLGHRRGRPMFFNAPRYAELERMWTGQDIGSFLARKVEATHDTGGWETM